MLGRPLSSTPGNIPPLLPPIPMQPVSELSGSVLRSRRHGSHTSLPPTWAGAAFTPRSPHGVPLPATFSFSLPALGVFGAQNEEGKPPGGNHAFLPGMVTPCSASQAGQGVAGSPGFRDSLCFSLACLWGDLWAAERGYLHGLWAQCFLVAPMARLLLAVWFPFRVSPIPFLGEVVPGRWPHLGLSESSAVPSLISFPYRLF